MSVPAEDQPSADAFLTNETYIDYTVREETHIPAVSPVLRLLSFLLDLRASGQINVRMKLL